MYSPFWLNPMVLPDALFPSWVVSDRCCASWTSPIVLAFVGRLESVHHPFCGRMDLDEASYKVTNEYYSNLYRGSQPLRLIRINPLRAKLESQCGTFLVLLFPLVVKCISTWPPWGCDLRWHGQQEEMAEDVSVETLGGAMGYSML